MPLSGSTSEYCSLDEARSAGCSVDDDVELNETIIDASRIVDAYCGTTFNAGAVQTFTLDDVRRPLVPLPVPFSGVTQVSVNGYVLDPSTYTVETWGLRLYSQTPVDYGWPVRGAVGGALDTWPYAAGSGPYGSQVAVTATFGYDTIPPLITRATKLLARNICRGTDGPFERGQTRLMVGQFDAQFTPHDPHPLDSTGDAEVDRLLRNYRRSTVLVG